MLVPPNTKTYEGELAILWFDENGILCANAKNSQRTLEKQQDMYAMIRDITKGEKVCLLSDVTNGSAQGKEIREYMAGQIPLYFKAMAIISESPFGKLVSNTFMNFENPIPIKMFSNQSEAVQWLKGFL